ncbi:MAG: hypothetical protein ACLQVJ_14175 [Syntrophobacteraceae bacterium]
MDFVFKDEIREFMQKRDDHCVSLYLPTHRAGRETEQDPIRLDNLLRGAEKELVAGGMRSPEARDLLEPALNLRKDGFFTRHLADGLSIFISKGLFRYFRLPIHFNEQLFVGRQFHLRPLAPMLHCCKRFYILTVSRKSVRLLECTEFGANEIELKDVPQGMREALGYDEESRLLFRTVPQASSPGGVPMFHGHGGGVESEKEDLWHYFQILKDSLHPYLREEEIPLVFAGVDYLFPMFRLVDVYKNTMNEIIEGNSDELDSQELLKRGLQVVSPYFHREREQAIGRYMDLSGGPLTSESLEEIVPSAVSGRIDTLFVDTGVQKWGKYDPVSGQVEVHSGQQNGDEDLLEVAFAHAHLNGGNVYGLGSVEMPGESGGAAVFRY